MVVEAAERVAVIGSGISGLMAAFVASKAGAEVTLYEAADRAGGHADTTLVQEGERTLAIDTGFIVHNTGTYPVLCRLFDELGVATQESEMSMSMSDDHTRLEWAGARGLAGVFPTWRHLAKADFLRMLLEIPRFHRAARALLEAGGKAPAAACDQTLSDFVEAGGFSPYFTRHFLEPLVAAVWSCDPAIAGQYPARYLFEFLANHGMLSVLGSPTWRTVSGGSKEYVERVLSELHAVLLGCIVESVYEHANGVEVVSRDLEQRSFDRVVIATHPDQALAMLTSATNEQKEVLSAFEYSQNRAALHTDTSLLPRARRTWASWNFRRPVNGDEGVMVTYDLTRLQRLQTDVHYLVTLGGEALIGPGLTMATRDYAHPIYTPTSVAAQTRLPEIDTDRIAFAGAYHGWGFHEDGARSGVAAAARLGFQWPAAIQPPAAKRIYETRVTHTRTRPWLRRFSHASYLWVVEIDAVDNAVQKRGGPISRLRQFASGTIAARDHLGSESGSLRENLAEFLSFNDVDLGDATVHLAAHPRAYGFCFNPISVWWCTRADGTTLATVIEVHNTYGDRHAYLVHPDDQGRAEVGKAMYVSPFHDVDGFYKVRVPFPTDSVEIEIALHAEGAAVFTAGLRGRRVEGHTVRAGVSGMLDAARIRSHGLRLWLRRLPVFARPDHHQEAVR